MTVTSPGYATSCRTRWVLLAALLLIACLGSATVALFAPQPALAQSVPISGPTDEEAAESGLPSTNNRRDANGAPRDEGDPVSIADAPQDVIQGRSNRGSVSTDRTSGVLGARLPPAPPSEFEDYASRVADKPIRRFGSNLLLPLSRGFTAPPDTSVPLDYRINAGDRIIVGLTGPVQVDNLELTVGPDGRIFIPNVGDIVVGGVRYGELETLIARSVSRVYREFGISVTMGRLRGVTVYVTGFAQTPGAYNVSSLSTLVNAVLAAGGPTAGGSFRSIQLRRDGRVVSDFDVYDLLLRGDRSGDVVLQNGDVIYIAPAGPQLAVIGSVNNEAIYEAAPNDTINDVLLYAGGISTVGDDSRLLVFNPLDVASGGWEELAADQVATRVARRGEIIRALSNAGIARSLEVQPVLVTISGEVARPGRYYLAPGASAESAIEQAGGMTASAFPYASVFTRQSVRDQQRESYARAIADLQLLLTTQTAIGRNDRPPQQIALLESIVGQLRERQPDGRVVFDLAPTATAIPSGIRLENNDTLYIPPRPVTVGIFGAVVNPTSVRYEPRRTIGQYVRQAGGVQSVGDRSEIFVVRANGTVISGRGGLFGGGVLGLEALPGDLIFVPIDANRGEFWARLRDVVPLLSTAALTGVALNGVLNN